MDEKCNVKVAELLTQKASLKQKVYEVSKNHFKNLKEVVESSAVCMNDVMKSVDQRVQTSFKDEGDLECLLTFGGDVLLFNMHTNVFTFDKSHNIWRQGYIKEDDSRSYFCMINIYNFLSDSLSFDRKDDSGVLLGRIFVNAEGHFFVEGRKQLGFKFNSLATQKISKSILQEVIDTAVICSMEYDLTVPDFNEVMLVSVRQVQAMSAELDIKTGKKVEIGYYSRMEKK